MVAQRKRKKTMLIFLGLELLLVVLILFSLVREYLRTRVIRQERNALESSVTKLIQEREDLSGLIQEFASPQFQEKIARTKLGLAKPEEKVYVVRGDLPPALDVAPGAATAELSPARLWWKYFFETRN